MAEDDVEEDANAAAPKRPTRAKATRPVASVETDNLEGSNIIDSVATEQNNDSSHMYNVESNGKPDDLQIWVVFDQVCAGSEPYSLQGVTSIQMTKDMA